MNQNTNIQLPGKPFNLEAAIAGEPLITSDGRKARYGTHSDKISHGFELFELYVWVEYEDNMETLYLYDKNGHRKGDDSTINDIFLAPIQVKKWVNVLQYEDGSLGMGKRLYDNEQVAKETLYNNERIAIHSTHEITIEL